MNWSPASRKRLYDSEGRRRTRSRRRRRRRPTSGRRSCCDSSSALSLTRSRSPSGPSRSGPPPRPRRRYRGSVRVRPVGVGYDVHVDIPSASVFAGRTRSGRRRAPARRRRRALVVGEFRRLVALQIVAIEVHLPVATGAESRSRPAARSRCVETLAVHLGRSARSRRQATSPTSSLFVAVLVPMVKSRSPRRIPLNPARTERGTSLSLRLLSVPGRADRGGGAVSAGHVVVEGYRLSPSGTPAGSRSSGERRVRGARRRRQCQTSDRKRRAYHL